MRTKQYSSHVSVLTLFIVILVMQSSQVRADMQRWNFNLETGAVWQGYNDVQIPGDTGTPFSLSDLTGDGPIPFYRLELLYNLTKRQQLRFLIAPLGYTESGVFNEDVNFDGQNFAAGETTEATYQFNTFRATYRYLFHDGPNWHWYVGGTLLLRDAEIALKQGNVSASSTDLGIVPLLNLYGDYRFANKWHFIVDFDGLASPQGRAIDLGLKLNYDIDRHWSVGGGLRVVEGGADNDEVYNFAQFNYALVSAGYRF
jgi:hypothetical protein